MIRTLFIIIFAVIATQISAQDTATSTTDTIPPNWKFSGAASVMLNQVGLYKWQGGGEPSFSATLLYKGSFNYKKDKLTWDNYIDFAYGLIQQGKKDMTKSDDRWEIGTKLGHQYNKHWDFNGFATLRSQFNEGFDPSNLETKISDFMAPGYLLTGLGFNYKKGDWLNINLSPATAKLTFVMNDSLANEEIINVDGVGTGKAKYGNTAGESFRSEIGAYAKVTIKKEILENVTLKTDADFFSDYLHNFGSVDVNWNLAIIMKVNKFITATVTTTLIYDEDIAIVLDKNNAGEALRIGPAVQFKETVGIGLSYTY